jgi:hypothetical protein
MKQKNKLGELEIYEKDLKTEKKIDSGIKFIINAGFWLLIIVIIIVLLDYLV